MLLSLLLVLLSKDSASMDPDTKELLTPYKSEGEFCGYESCPEIRAGEINVHLVPYTHFEMAQAATFEDHYTGSNRIYAKTEINVKRAFDHIISELWVNEDRKFTIGDIAYFFYWWSKRDGTVRRMVYQLVRQGRLSFVGGGFVMPDEATTSYHAIIEAFTFSLRKINATFWDCGRPLVSWQPDILGHSREMASLMAQMGFDGHFVAPISFDDHVVRMQRQGLEMLWRGSDDLGMNSDIFTHVLFDGFRAPPGFCFSSKCTDPLVVASSDAFRNDEERAKLFVNSMLHRQAPNYNTSNVMVVMGAYEAYFDAVVWFASIEKLISAIDRLRKPKTKGVNVVYSTPYCYLRAAYLEKPALETKQDDFYPFAGNSVTYGTGLYTTSPPVKLLARQALVYLQIAKQLQILAKLFNNDSKFEAIQWIFSAFQDHTVITGNMREYVKKNYVQKMDKAILRSTLIMKQAFNKIRKSPTGTIYYRCQFNMSVCHTGNRLLVIYNPLAWPVTMPVRLPCHNRYNQVYAPNGEVVPAAVVKLPEMILRMPGRNASMEHELVFIAEKIPALGLRSYFVESHADARKRKRQHGKYDGRKRNRKGAVKNRKKRDNNATKRSEVKSKGEMGNAPTKKHGKNYRSKNTMKGDNNNKTAISDKIIHRNNNRKAYNNTDIAKTKQNIRIKEKESVEMNIDQRREKVSKTQKSHDAFSKNNEVKRAERSSFVRKNFDTKRPIIKKINKSKKYLMRQNNMKTDDREPPLIRDMESDDDEYELRDENKLDANNNTFANISNITEISNINETLMPSMLESVTSQYFFAEDRTTQQDFFRVTTERNAVLSAIDTLASNTGFNAMESAIEPDSFGNNATESYVDRETTKTYEERKLEVSTAQNVADLLTRVGETSTESTLEPESLENTELPYVNETETDLSTTEKIETTSTVKTYPTTSTTPVMKNRGELGDRKDKNINITEIIFQYLKNASLQDSKAEWEYSKSGRKSFNTTEQMQIDKTNKNNDFKVMPLQATRRGGLYNKSQDNFIENQYVRITLDPKHRKINGMYLSNGVNISLDIQFYYYAADDPEKLLYTTDDDGNPVKNRKAPPGVYCFRSVDNVPVAILDYLDVKVYKTDIVQEVQYQYADHASLSVRLYVDSPTVEADWVVAPVPITPEYVGTDIFIRYMTDLASEGNFYTDSNGRQTIKRVRHTRPMYDHVNDDPVAGNYYPVTSKIYIEDENKNIRLSVFPDRAQGGASLADGEVDLMVQRRVNTDDQSELNIFANDTEFGQPIWVRGKHILYLSKADYKPNKIFEKKLAKELELQPLILTSKNRPYGPDSKSEWLQHVNEYSFLKTKLPLGVHLLTVQEWTDNTLLIRLENYLERSDTVKSGIKRVFLRDLFTPLRIQSVKETTLAANIWLKDYVPLLWKRKDRFAKNFNEFYGSGKPVEWAEDAYLKDDVDLDQGIVLRPQQIRTFVCSYEFV